MTAKAYKNMHPTDHHYLTKIPNEAQYPAAFCSMGDNICMCSLSASLGIESMNRANMDARKATAVDMLNVTMLLIRKESIRFEQFKTQAHKTFTLTPRRMDLWEDAFKGVESIDSTYVLADMESYYQCSISKITENAFVYTVKIPKTDTFGSHFGNCTCGVQKRDGIPCEHMVMMVKAGVIQEDWFMRLSIMPYWLTTAHWHLQFPQTIVCCGDINVNIIKGKYQAQNDVCYCPTWSGPNKSGRPGKAAGIWKPGLMDHIEKARMRK